MSNQPIRRRQSLSHLKGLPEPAPIRCSAGVGYVARLEQRNRVGRVNTIEVRQDQIPALLKQLSQVMKAMAHPEYIEQQKVRDQIGLLGDLRDGTER